MMKMTQARKQKKGVSAPQVQQMIDPFSAEGDAIDIKSLDENWCQYELKDGTTLRLKPVIMEIRRLKNQYAQNGDPIYVIKSVVVNDIKVNDPNLKRK